MAKQALIRKLSAFFRLQAEDRKTVAVLDDDSLVVEKIMNEPNPGVVRAKKNGLTITVTQGDKIVEISPNNTVVEIGTVRRDVPVGQGRYPVQ